MVQISRVPTNLCSSFTPLLSLQILCPRTWSWWLDIKLGCPSFNNLWQTTYTINYNFRTYLPLSILLTLQYSTYFCRFLAHFISLLQAIIISFHLPCTCQNQLTFLKHPFYFQPSWLKWLCRSYDYTMTTLVYLSNEQVDHKSYDQLARYLSRPVECGFNPITFKRLPLEIYYDFWVMIQKWKYNL